MKSFSVRQAKQRFSDIILAACDGPVAITRYKDRIAVVMTPRHYRMLLAAREAAQYNALAYAVDDIARGGAPRSFSHRLLAALKQ
jgi:PHD/YefM family antitoxin component YafN of YafNO toxin-antitoxin module